MANSELSFQEFPDEKGYDSERNHVSKEVAGRIARLQERHQRLGNIALNI